MPRKMLKSASLGGGAIVKKEGSQAASPPAPPADSQPVNDVGGINSEHYSKVQDAMNVIESVPELKQIRDMMPASVAGGASIVPFNAKIFKEKLENNEVYTCEHNVFLTNPLRDASPGCQPAPSSFPN